MKTMAGASLWVALELADQRKRASEAIRGFAKLVRRLPRSVATVWNLASKEFDLGIQAGFEPRSREWILEPDVVELVSDLGAQLRVTVYSPLLAMQGRKGRQS